MPARIIDIVFPLGGLDRSTSYQRRPPYTARACLNVRARETAEGRARGGSRPGLVKTYPDRLGNGAPVEMLAAVHQRRGTLNRMWRDDFDYDVFQATPLDQAAELWDGLPQIAGAPLTWPGGYVYAPASQPWQSYYGVARTPIVDFDPSAPYELSMMIYGDGVMGQNRLDVWSLVCCMDDPADNRNNSLTFHIVTNAAGSEVSSVDSIGKSFVNGVQDDIPTVSTADWSAVPFGPTLVAVEIDPVQQRAVTRVAGQDHRTFDLSGYSLPGSRIGFLITSNVAQGLAATVSHFAVSYLSTTEQVRRRTIVAAAAGNVYRDSEAGRLVPILSSHAALKTGHLTMAAEHDGKLYIADYSTDQLESSSGRIENSNELVDTAGEPDQFDGVDATLDVVELYDATGGTTPGVYDISTVAPTRLTLSTAPGDGYAAYRIWNRPAVYDPSTDAMSVWSAASGKGTVPPGCPLAARYRGRMVLAGARGNPHVWYMSRMNDPLDWDYSRLDAQAAVAGTTSEIGVIAEPLTALAPWLDDYLIFGCASAMYRLIGDPGRGGRIQNLSKQVGPLGAGAWCFTDNGSFLFLSHSGLYELPAGGIAPQALSQRRVPRDLLDVNEDDTVLMAWDHRSRGAHVFIGNRAQARTHWYFDYDNRAFWPDAYDVDHQPASLLEVTPQQFTRRIVILGCNDGYLRHPSTLQFRDDDKEFHAYADLGPIRLSGGEYREGVLNELSATVGLDSGTVNWAVRVADTQEEAAKDTADSRLLMESGEALLMESGDALLAENLIFASGSWEAGRNPAEMPRARGGAMILRLESPARATGPWLVDSITARIQDGGRQRPI